MLENAQWKIRSISEFRARSPWLVQVRLGQIVESHIARGYFIIRKTGEKKEKDGSRAIFTFTIGWPALFDRKLLEEESRFEINLAVLGQEITTCEQDT